MRIGEDFDKMEFSFLGLDLLEPNALITDTLIAVVGITLGFIVARQNKKTINSPFLNYWKILFFVYGIGFFFGGMGHVFFNYFGVYGKYFPLIGGFGIPLFIEHAMITLLPQEKQKKLFMFSKIKAIIAFIVLTVVVLTVKGEKTLPALLLVPSVNSLIGFGWACGVLGVRFGRSITRSFYLLPLTVLILVPAAIFQMFKINIHPWFDRNDAGHLLIITTLILYYYAVQGYRKHLLETTSQS